MTKLTKENFINALKEMSLLEIKELVDGLKEEFGVDPNALSISNSNNDNNKPKEEEKTSFTVIMKEFGSNKMSVIKAAREVTGLGLLDTKTLIETQDAVIKEKISKEESEEIKSKLESAGAVIEIK